MTARPPYNGAHRKLLLAFDVGTTYSGVSYSILTPGQVPEIKSVTRYPAQERVGGDSKIPTIIYYNKDGGVEAVGAEATTENVHEKAEDEGWIKAEWFKLHLRPKTTSTAGITQSLPSLPENKTVVDLFADFLRYLYACTKDYIQGTYANGAGIWTSAESQGYIDFVLSHPNGWGGAQQAQMRTAAIRAGLIPDKSDGHERVHFVTEGEASLHFCIQNGLTTESLKNGDGILIVDAGGGTIDISAYAHTASTTGFSFEEITSPQCHLQGSIFVTSRAHTYLQVLLQGTRFSGDVEHITNCFDKTTKLTFRNPSDSQFIKFGTVRDKDIKLNIRSGQLKVPGVDVADFFEPSISCIVRAIMEQSRASVKVISSIFLVGGFAANDWLFTKLQRGLEQIGFIFCRPDTHVNKAVADGAVSFYLDHFVGTRVSRFTYGVNCGIPHEPRNAEHVQRKSSIYFGCDGRPMISGHFDVILQKDTQISESAEYRSSYIRQSRNQAKLRNISAKIVCYQGSDIPRWSDVNSEMYSTLCHVEADTSDLAMRLELHPGPENREAYYELDFDIALLFGLTELKAQLCWIENGEEKRGPVSIVYEPDTIIHDNAEVKS
ncbi:hypothetical protein BDZ94DRAFT_414257 [Collybia nuda]|uniref:Heat shock 70 kDa protein 12A n=1 Tax=Collybia nuda TaxID=64659 RepID=A0A9P6CKB9_9AGAR|nr:hypothetical protein BDZ94DRAFT_414257 [Collybia nuda]